MSLSVGENGEDVLDIPVDESDRTLDKISVHIALSKLSDREQRLMQLRFFEGKTQSETARVLGISQVQVSRKEKSIISKLRSVLE